VSEWMESKNVRPGQEALDEVKRELSVRQRCFPRWIRDGRVSATDAQDRIDRLATAYDLLEGLVNGMLSAPVTSSGDMTPPGQSS
jgi:hypothetical protein